MSPQSPPIARFFPRSPARPSARLGAGRPGFVAARAAGWLAAAALVGGCVPLTPPPADLANRAVGRPGRFAATQPTALSAESAKSVDTNWLADFQDDTLSALVAEALAHNPDLLVSAARLDEVQQRVIVAGSRLYPQLDAVGSAGRSKSSFGGSGPITSTSYALGGRASWELDLWGRVRADAASARLSAEASELDLQFARLSLAAQVADAWFVAVQAQLQLAIDQERLVSEDRTNRVTRDKVATGVGGQLDAELQEANVRLAREAVEADRQAIEQSKKALEVLLGRYPASDLAIAAALPTLGGEAPTGLPSELLERRPDVRAADRQVAAAFYDRTAAQAARLPSVTLSADLGWLIDPSASYWSLTGGLLAPLFTGGRLEAQARAADARQRGAVASYVAAAIRAFQEVESALANEQFFIRRQAELEEAVNRSAGATRIGEDRYAAGVLGIVDLTTIRRQDFQSRGQLLQVQAGRVRQRLALYRALGGSFAAPQAVATAGPRPNTITK
jgi:NodT family efflux transporter outer membrane factor (OMF) lipoprotein